MSTLAIYYPVVKTFRDYLAHMLQDSFLHGDSTSDATEYLELLDHGLVAIEDAATLEVTKLGVQSAGTLGMREVRSLLMLFLLDMLYNEFQIIDKAQERLFTKFGGKPSNLITDGYRSVCF
jgi:hypothetical protein